MKEAPGPKDITRHHAIGMWSRKAAEPTPEERVGWLVDQCGTDAGTAIRFLKARDWDAESAAAALEAHADWLKTPLGQTARTEEVDAILATDRFRVLRRGAEPVILVDFMWGEFLGGIDIPTMVRAYVFLARELFEGADTERRPDDPAQAIVICTGGPPPVAYVRALQSVMEPHFPERLRMSVVYPIPWMMKMVVNGFIAFLPRATRDKFRLCATCDELLELTGLSLSEVPVDLQGGAAAQEAAEALGTGDAAETS